MAITFPSDEQRQSIIGATGSGKTHAAMWHLSMRNYDVMPWIIYDFKRDSFINQIEGTQILSFDMPVPKRPGIYLVQPLPDQDDERVEAQMWEIWNNENTGVYVDEGYMIGKNNRAFRALLTQGRSKRIPMITLTQRPVWIDRFVLSESEFFQVFRLTHKDDVKAVNAFIPYDIKERLPERHSYYYDVIANRICVLGMVPDRKAIASTFDRKLRRIRKVV